MRSSPRTDSTIPARPRGSPHHGATAPATLLTFLAVVASGCGPTDVDRASAPDELHTRFAEEYVTTDDGVRLYARIVGVGPDTVLIPAAVYLARDLTRLAPGRTLIFYDPRGRGGSEYVRDTTRIGIEWDLRDLEAVRSHFGIGRVSLVGWSYLGAVVALYAAERPERVRRVVQIGPMAPRDETARIPDERGSPPDSADLALLARLEREGLPETDPLAYCREYTMLRLVRPMMGRPEAATRSRMDPCTYWNEWPDQLFRTIRHLLRDDWDYTEEARRVEAPVLTVHGTDDPNAAVEGGREWASLLPDARLLEIEGVGHAPWLEAPEEFFGEVDAFLRGG